MEFWRNESTTSFDPEGSAAPRLEAALSSMRGGGRAVAADAAEALLRLLPSYLPDTSLRGSGFSNWCLQEVWWGAGVLRMHIVLPRTARQIVGSAVAGGIGVWIEGNGAISAELSVYLHRLVCTNGMVRKLEAASSIRAADESEWLKVLESTLPRVLAGISSGSENLTRSAQVRLGLLRPLVPVALDYLNIRDPERGLILDAFAAEPGDTLWHFVNAVSRAANLVLLEHDVDPDEALRKRHRLQRNAMQMCETALEHFVEGRSLFDTVPALREVLET